MNLGKSTIQIQIPGCNWFRTVEQENYESLHQGVPASLLEVQILNIKDTVGNDIQHLTDYFQGDQPVLKTINLLNTQTEEDALTQSVAIDQSRNENTGIEKEEPASLVSLEDSRKSSELVRFQYDGILTMTVSLLSENLLSCSNYTKDVNADSFYVVAYMKVVQIRIDLKYEIVKDEVYCDKVDTKEHKLQIESNLGMDRNAGFPEFYEKLEGDSKDYISECSTIGVDSNTPPTGPCIEPIEHDKQGNNAGLDVFLAAGRPNISPEYTKNVIIKVIGGTTNVQHRSDFFIEGLFSKGPGNSFALPSHKPIMILRDPPGEPYLLQLQQ